MYIYVYIHLPMPPTNSHFNKLDTAYISLPVPIKSKDALNLTHKTSSHSMDLINKTLF